MEVKGASLRSLTWRQAGGPGQRDEVGAPAAWQHAQEAHSASPAHKTGPVGCSDEAHVPAPASRSAGGCPGPTVNSSVTRSASGGTWCDRQVANRKAVDAGMARFTNTWSLQGGGASGKQGATWGCRAGAPSARAQRCCTQAQCAGLHPPSLMQPGSQPRLRSACLARPRHLCGKVALIHWKKRLT